MDATRERGVRLFRENRAAYSSDSAAYRAIAPKLGCSPDSLRAWCQQSERDSGQRAGLTSAEKDLIKDLEREVRDRGLIFHRRSHVAGSIRNDGQALILPIDADPTGGQLRLSL